MFTHRHGSRRTASIAVLSACFIVASAQAGPLGAVGSIGGGLSGSAAPRQLDAGARAAAHGGATLPRGDQGRAAAGAAISKAGETKAQAADKAVETKAGATATGNAAKEAALDKAADARAAAHGKTALSGAAKAGGETSASGSAQTSRERGALNARASVHGSARP